jgi:hypothetical protein
MADFRFPAAHGPQKYRTRLPIAYTLYFIAGFYCCWMLNSYKAPTFDGNASTRVPKTVPIVAHEHSHTPPVPRDTSTARRKAPAIVFPGSPANATETPTPLKNSSDRRLIYQKRLHAWRQRLSMRNESWNKWAPLILEKCEPGMPKHWAPCLKVPGAQVLAAYELLYPGRPEIRDGAKQHASKQPASIQNLCTRLVRGQVADLVMRYPC